MTTATVGELELHRPALVAHCRRVLGSSLEAEDAAQEAIVRAWRNLDRFEGRSSLRSWLWRIATNVCLDMVDSPQRRPLACELPTIGDLVGNAADPADRVVLADRVGAATAVAAARLTSQQRAALILCEVLRWPAAETAARLGVSVASVNSSLQRARAALAAA